MITRTFLDKTNTIRMGSHENYGLHPVCMLNYGGETTRILVHFDIDNIAAFLKDKEKALECRHILKMTNCGSADIKKFGLKVPSYDINGIKSRATSFTLYAFPIDEEWDAGVGFDSSQDFWLSGTGIVSDNGSNWFNSKTGYKWLKNGCIGLNVDVTNAVAMQHFDRGNENMELDITDYVNSIVFSGMPNNGLCISFDPVLESCIDIDITGKTRLTQYVGFFGNKTNTFFEPVVESRIDDYIRDDRYNFTLGRKNRLYFYACENSRFVNLDNNPICTIGCVDELLPVVQQDTGVYYVEFALNSKPDMIYYDTWDNLSVDGEHIGSMEFDFVTHPSASRFSLGPDMPQEHLFEPSLSGLNDDEILNKGDVRRVNVKFRIPYDTKYFTLNDTQYRIYSKDGNREVTVIDWEWINNAGSVNYFIIKADELVPGDYFVDIRVKTKSQVKTFKEKLRFRKANDITRITR